MKTKKYIFHQMVLVLVLFAYLLPVVHAADFSLKKDGSVRIGGQDFISMSEYVTSEYFRKNGMRCGTGKTQGDGHRVGGRSAAHCTDYFTNIRNEYWPADVYEIPVLWHVIYRNDGVGNISDAAINDQMEVLNEDFRAESGTMGGNGFDVKIQFVLEAITRTINDQWFSDSDGDEIAYKSALGKDTRRYLNIYTNDARGYLGYATLPQYSAGSLRDGIVLNYETVGGRNNSFHPYNQGRTLVHEMGHYLGLLHTFEGGCTNSYSSGDLIADTNAEAFPNYEECNAASSCGSSDPIHNYMDYSYDACMYEFTREQANRAVCSLVNYRPRLFRGAVVMVPLLSPLILGN